MKLALTFDDGPSAWTPLVLDLLRENDARASFFLIGERVRERPDDVRRIVAEGHEVGSHTLTHPRLTEIPDDEVRSEILGGVEALQVLAQELSGQHGPQERASRQTRLRAAIAAMGEVVLQFQPPRSIAFEPAERRTVHERLVFCFRAKISNSALAVSTSRTAS